MPQFKWKGRTRDGREVQGETDASSKEDVAGRLRGLGILVQSISGAGDDGSVLAVPEPLPEMQRPAVPESLVDRMNRERSTQKPQRLKGLLFVAFLVAVALGVGLMDPVTIYRCERLAGQGVECRIIERDLGVVPIREQTITGVVSVDYESRNVTTTGRRNTKVETSQTRLRLQNGKGASITPIHWDDDGRVIGEPTGSIAATIGDMVRGGIDGPRSMWQVSRSVVIASGAILSFALLMLVLFVLSFFKGPTEWVYAGAGRLAALADERRRRQGR